jgi:hypothetical protein
VLFTNQELEPYQPYRKADAEDGLPHKYPMNFSDLARNAEHRYLLRADEVDPNASA